MCREVRASRASTFQGHPSPVTIGIHVQQIRTALLPLDLLTHSNEAELEFPPGAHVALQNKEKLARYFGKTANASSHRFYARSGDNCPTLQPAAHAGLVVPIGAAEAPIEIRLLARDDAIADRDNKRQREDQDPRA